MRHRVDHRKLNRTSSHRRAMLRNMVTSLFDKERITTTDAKAKEARRFAERLITRAKKGHNAYKEIEALRSAGKEEEAKQMQAVALSHWRQASRHIQKMSVLRKLFNELAPLYDDREGGYTRILRIGTRQGDNAQTVMLELVGTKITSQPRVIKPRKKKVEEETPEAAAPAVEEEAAEAEGKESAVGEDTAAEAEGAKPEESAGAGEKAEASDSKDSAESAEKSAAETKADAKAKPKDAKTEAKAEPKAKAEEKSADSAKEAPNKDTESKDKD